MIIHMYEKWRKVVPKMHWPETCPEPTEEERKNNKKEGKLRGELKQWKRQQKRGVLDTLDRSLFEDDDGGGKPAAKRVRVETDVEVPGGWAGKEKTGEGVTVGPVMPSPGEKEDSTDLPEAEM